MAIDERCVRTMLSEAQQLLETLNRELECGVGPDNLRQAHDRIAPIQELLEASATKIRSKIG